MPDSVIITILVVLAAATGALFKPGEWYFRLRKPIWTPPNWAFPVVWTVLYIMIAVAGWLIASSAGWGIVAALWLLQLVLNGAWSWLFFGRKRMDLAFVDVCLLWVSIGLLMIGAWPVSSWASVLLAPYWLWVTIAAALNWTVMKMNPDAARA